MNKMTKGTEKTLDLFDRTNRPRVIDAMKKQYQLQYDIAENIWQDAWVTLLTKLDDGSLTAIPEKLDAYMWGICHNKAMEYSRKLTKEKVFDSYSLDDEENKTLSDLVSETAQCLSEKDYKQRMLLKKLEIMDMALEDLTEKNRKLVTSFYYDHKNYKVLAKELGFKNEDVAKSTKKRVIEMMQHYVAAHFSYSDAA